MATMYLIWDRKERRVVGGPFSSTGEATAHTARVRSKSPDTQGAKLLDTVSVTVP